MKEVTVAINDLKEIKLDLQRLDIKDVSRENQNLADQCLTNAIQFLRRGRNE